MSAASVIRPYLLEADRRRPDLKLTNTAQSCFELLQLTVALAGPEWAFIGKTRNMDGASVTPPGFTPITMTLMRPDGQLQTIMIVGLSMDAAFHLPTRQQVKVIANSSANDDDDPAIHGPAKLTPYDIDPQYYRWHNPPIPQFGRVAEPWTPPSQPPASSPSVFRIPSYAELGDDAFFRAMIGVPLQADMLQAGQQLNDGSSVWFSRATYEILTEAIKAGHMIDVAPIVKKYRNQWRAILNLPPV